jgi:hypothetical protein
MSGGAVLAAMSCTRELVAALSDDQDGLKAARQTTHNVLLYM